METEVNSIVEELRKDAPKDSMSAAADAVADAQKAILAAKSESDETLKVITSLRSVPQILSGVRDMIGELKGSGDTMAKIAVSMRDGDETNRSELEGIIRKQVSAIQQGMSAIAEEVKRNEGGSADQVKLSVAGLSSTIKNLIQEIEGGIKVSVENQKELPVVGFSRGSVSGVDQAMPVMLVDQNGRPYKGGGSGKGGSGNVGQEIINDPLNGFRPSDADEASDPKYYGFLKTDGSWYILRDTANSAWRYFKGSSAYTTNWTNRASLSYDYFDVIF